MKFGVLGVLGYSQWGKVYLTILSLWGVCTSLICYCSAAYAKVPGLPDPRITLIVMLPKVCELIASCIVRIPSHPFTPVVVGN